MGNSIIDQQAQTIVSKEVKRFILTSAQNNTRVHAQLWRNLLAFSEHMEAKLMVASFTYNKSTNPVGGRKAKRKTSKETDNEPEYWDANVVPFLCDKRIELAPGLTWCGEVQILPTAVNPLSGMESYTGRSSTIIPHPKFTVTSVASPKHKGTKFMWTTGTVTESNYIQKKAGQKADFHHGFGALSVSLEVLRLAFRPPTGLVLLL